MSAEGHSEPVRALIACSDGHVAVAVGPGVRVLDTGAQNTRLLETSAVIRCLAFSCDGRYLAAGTDSKPEGLLVWDTTSWQCVHKGQVAKKVSCVAFSPSSTSLLAGDKFGDVLGAALVPDVVSLEPTVLLGHYSSALASLAMSATGRYLASGDRDGRLRVSLLQPASAAVLPAHEVQAYCFGHTAFVTCCAFVGGSGGEAELLVSSSGDGTLRLWQPETGTLLDTVHLGSMRPASGAQQEQGGEEDGAGPAAVLALAVCGSGGYVAAVVDGRDDVYVARVDCQQGRLQGGQWSQLPGLHIPSQLCFDGADRLWVAGGPAHDASPRVFLACAALRPDATLGDTLSSLVAGEALALLRAGKASASPEEEQNGQRPQRLFAAHLQRRSYPLEEIERRKAKRRDKVAAREAGS